MPDTDNRGLRALDDVLELLSAEGRSVQTITLHPDGRIDIALGPPTEPNPLDRWRLDRKAIGATDKSTTCGPSGKAVGSGKNHEDRS